MQSTKKTRDSQTDQLQQQRRNRFLTTTIGSMKSNTETNIALIGSCETLEKDYFRLTSAPDPSTVRPLPILNEAFQFVMKKYRSNNDWNYISNQLKSIRQDLMVQWIRNDFTILVYEENARIALEMADRDQFIQCQTQLEILYDDGGNRTHYNEFLIYRLLYSLLLNDHRKFSRLLEDLDRCKKNEKSTEEFERLQLVENFCRMFHRKNYFAFFQLYRSLPYLAQCLVDLFLDIHRQEIVRILIWSFLPSLPLDVFNQILSYQSNDICQRFLNSLGVVLTEESMTVDCRLSRNVLKK